MPEINLVVFVLILVAVAIATFITVSIRRASRGFTFGTPAQTVGQQFWAGVNIYSDVRPCELSIPRNRPQGTGVRSGVWVSTDALYEFEGHTALKITTDTASGDRSWKTPVLAVYNAEKNSWVLGFYDGQDERELICLEEFDANHYALATVIGYFKISEAPFSNGDSFE